MAKAKKKKAQKGKGILEPDVMVYIYSLAAIAVSLIGCLQIGFAGSLLTSLLQYLCGTLYGVVYAEIMEAAARAVSGGGCFVRYGLDDPRVHSIG